MYPYEPRKRTLWRAHALDLHHVASLGFVKVEELPHAAPLAEMAPRPAGLGVSSYVGLDCLIQAIQVHAHGPADAIPLVCSAKAVWRQEVSKVGYWNVAVADVAVRQGNAFCLVNRNADHAFAPAINPPCVSLSRILTLRRSQGKDSGRRN